MTDLKTTITNPDYNNNGCHEITVSILDHDRRERTFRVTCDCEANPETTIETTTDRPWLMEIGCDPTGRRLGDFAHAAECAVIDYLNDGF